MGDRTAPMKVRYLLNGVEHAAIIDPAENRLSATEWRIWTEVEFRERFFANNVTAARKAYVAYRRSYAPPPDSEAGRFLRLLMAGKTHELEEKYVYRIERFDDGTFQVQFSRRAYATERKRAVKPRPDSGHQKNKQRQHAGPWLIYTAFETNRRKH
jgi:hypothetical protein